MSKSDLTDRRRESCPPIHSEECWCVVLGCPCFDLRSRSMPRSSTMRAASPWFRLRRSKKDNRANLKTGADVDAAKMVGELIAKRAVEAGVSEVVFDRGAYNVPWSREGSGRRRA